jgi:hypothetical protein
VLFFTCTEDVMQARVLGRQQGRTDDSANVIKQRCRFWCSSLFCSLSLLTSRFRTFMELQIPIIEQFDKLGKVRTISAEGSIAEVFARVQKVLEDVLPAAAAPSFSAAAAYAAAAASGGGTAAAAAAAGAATPTAAAGAGAGASAGSLTLSSGPAAETKQSASGASAAVAATPVVATAETPTAAAVSVAAEAKGESKQVAAVAAAASAAAGKQDPKRLFNRYMTTGLLASVLRVLAQ